MEWKIFATFKKNNLVLQGWNPTTFQNPPKYDSSLHYPKLAMVSNSAAQVVGSNLARRILRCFEAYNIA